MRIKDTVSIRILVGIVLIAIGTIFSNHNQGILAVFFAGIDFAGWVIFVSGVIRWLKNRK